MRAIKLIGGPAHGLAVAVPNVCEVYRLPVMPGTADAIAPPPDGPVELITVNYRRREIMGTEVWAHEMLRDPQVFEILVNHFLASK